MIDYSGSVPWAQTVVLSMSTFPLLELKSAGLLEVKRPLAEVASPAPMLGSSTCVDPLAPSTTPKSCLWLRVSSLNSLQFATLTMQEIMVLTILLHPYFPFVSAFFCKDNFVLGF